MVKWCAAASAFAILAACGGTAPERIISPPATSVRFAAGPIASACLIHNRPAASRARCGCIQAVADRTLSQQQQQRSVVFFSDPGQLQDIRQSDAPGNERFWNAWKNFAETAEVQCQSV
ncbi:hypothetical protein ACOTTU_12815 [Roseobacter sp. EG26]|uniref:hypothetical protein n=1 Tax=Roseobacter sp. EG26 TaxID=3412477 RepID=UPI002630015A|nr:hypothetical protein [uncultured Roseobacter sp.]